jgi:hypothetical protein
MNRNQYYKGNKMKKLLALLALTLASTAFAGGEMKEICKDKLDKAGKVVNGKDGKPVQVCKKIKVHKKVEGDKVPEPAKKK